jgi:hypothetical protein
VGLPGGNRFRLLRDLGQKLGLVGRDSDRSYEVILENGRESFRVEPKLFPRCIA